MSTKGRNEHTDETQRAERGAPKLVSRRAILRGAVTTMPVVLTLQSGAALARSSNMISASHYSSQDRHGRTLCLDTDSVYPADGSGQRFDLGEPPRAHVYAINERDYRVAPHPNASRITEEQICKNGEPAYYRSDTYAWTDDDDEWEDDDAGDDDGEDYWGQQGTRYQRNWEQVQVRRGVLVSATALTSFAGSVQVTDL